MVGILRDYCQQGRRTAELLKLIEDAQGSTPPVRSGPPVQRELHHSVVTLLVQDYGDGASTYDLAKRYNLRRNTVRDVLRREGLDLSVRANRPKLTDAQKVQARERYAAGLTQRELADAYGVSLATIRRVLRRR